MRRLSTRCIFLVLGGLWVLAAISESAETTSAAPAATATVAAAAGALATVAETPALQVPSAQAPADPAPVADEKIPGGMEGFISLDLRSIDIVDAMKYLSTKAGLNIVTTKNVAGRVTLMVEDVPVKDVFDIMLRSNKLAYDQTGQIYNVMTEDEYKALYGKPFSDTRKVETFRLNYAIPEQAFALLDTMKSEIGRVLVDQESGNVLVIDIPEKIQAMRDALVTFEQRNEVRLFTLQYAKAKDVEEQLKSQLDTKKVGLIKADERANQVMVQTLPERMKDIERIIKELDVKTREVIIETTIIKIKLLDTTTKGISWEGLFNLAKDKGLFYAGSTPFTTVNPTTTAGNYTTRKETFANENDNVGSYPFSGNTAVINSSVPKVGTEEVHLGLVAAQDADVIMKYVQTLGTTKILANPKLVVTNNQESRIHVGEKQAYVTTTTTTGQISNTVAEDVTFVDVGIQLAVTPTINEEGFVTMKVKTEISSVTSTLTTPSLNKIPIIDTSLAETTVMVKEGTTIVIGGLRRDERTSDAKQTPILGKIPLVGNLFKTNTDKIDRTELMIMLTPKVITGETLVTEAGQKVENSGIKDKQSYKSIPSPAISTVGMADVERKPVFKTLRVAE